MWRFCNMPDPKMWINSIPSEQIVEKTPLSGGNWWKMLAQWYWHAQTSSQAVFHLHARSYTIHKVTEVDICERRQEAEPCGHDSGSSILCLSTPTPSSSSPSSAPLTEEDLSSLAHAAREEKSLGFTTTAMVLLYQNKTPVLERLSCARLSVLHHTSFKWTALHQALHKPDSKRFIWTLWETGMLGNGVQILQNPELIPCFSSLRSGNGTSLLLR